MTTQINNDHSMMVSSQNESCTEIASTNMEEVQKTEGDSATIARYKEKRTLLRLLGGCLHGRFQKHVHSSSFRSYSLPRQSLWITMTVCLTIVTVYQASNLVQHMIQQTTIVQSQITTEKNVPFPAVTICSQEPFQKNKLKHYQSQTASTPSIHPINDFDAVWEIYKLEEALKIHAEQPSCEDNISNIECSLKPAQCSKKEDSNLQTRMPNSRKIRRQRSLEKSVLSDLDLSLSSSLLYDSSRLISKPRSLSMTPTSTILEPSFSQLLNNFVFDNFGYLKNVCYGRDPSVDPYFSNDIDYNAITTHLSTMYHSYSSHDTVYEDSLLYFSDEYIEFMEMLYYYFPSQTFDEIVLYFSREYYGYDVESDSETFYQLIPGIYNSLNELTDYSTITYTSGGMMEAVVVYQSPVYAYQYLPPNNYYSLMLDTLYYWFPGHTYYEIIAYLNPTFYENHMEHPHNNNNFGLSMHLDTLYYYFPSYTYYEIVEYFSYIYGHDYWQKVVNASTVDSLTDSEFLYVLYQYFPSNTYTEIMQFLQYLYSLNNDIDVRQYDHYEWQMQSKGRDRGRDIEYGAASNLYTLEAMYRDDTYNKTQDSSFSQIFNSRYRSADPINPRGGTVGQNRVDALYTSEYTYNELLQRWYSVYPSTYPYTANWDSMSNTIQGMYSLYPEYSFTAIIGLLMNEACAVIPDIAGEEEVDMLRMLVLGSPFANPMDLLQWSSISTRQIEEFGFTYSELISGCSYNGDTCDQSDFTKWSNDRYGNCFTFNSEFNSETKPRKANKPGKQNGLKLVLNSMEEKPAEYRISIHHPAEVPMPEESGIDVSAEKISILPTSVQLRERLPEPQGTCKETAWALDGSQTLDGCKKLCQEEMIRLTCKCKKMMLRMTEDIADKLPECGSRNMRCLRTVTKKYNRDSCSHCFAPCQEITYNTEIAGMGTSQTNGRCIDDLTMEASEYRKISPSVIHVYLENLQIERLTETLSYPLQDAMTEAGIWIYFFLGLSVLGLLEFILELLIMLASKRDNPIKNVAKGKTVTIKYKNKLP